LAPGILVFPVLESLGIFVLCCFPCPLAVALSPVLRDQRTRRKRYHRRFFRCAAQAVKTIFGFCSFSCSVSLAKCPVSAGTENSADYKSLLCKPLSLFVNYSFILYWTIADT